MERHAAVAAAVPVVVPDEQVEPVWAPVVVVVVDSFAVTAVAIAEAEAVAVVPDRRIAWAERHLLPSPSTGDDRTARLREVES